MAACNWAARPAGGRESSGRVAHPGSATALAGQATASSCRPVRGSVPLACGQRLAVISSCAVGPGVIGRQFDGAGGAPGPVCWSAKRPGRQPRQSQALRHRAARWRRCLALAVQPRPPPPSSNSSSGLEAPAQPPVLACAVRSPPRRQARSSAKRSSWGGAGALGQVAGRSVSIAGHQNGASSHMPAGGGVSPAGFRVCARWRSRRLSSLQDRRHAVLPGGK
jgi:hypothetical protein